MTSTGGSIIGKGESESDPSGEEGFQVRSVAEQLTSERLFRQFASTNSQAVNVVFREPVQKILENVRNEPFFKWPNKMAGDPMNRNQNLYCHYHQDHGHTTEECRNLWDHLEQLVRERRLKHLLHHSSGRGGQTGLAFQGNAISKPPLGTINVIFR